MKEDDIELVSFSPDHLDDAIDDLESSDRA
jgi:hypothetical protein